MNPIDFPSLIQVSTPDLSSPTIGGIISALLPYVFVIAGFALLAYLVIGGYQIMTGGGDPKKIAAGKEKILYAIVGFLIVFASYFIIQIIGQALNIRAIQDIFGGPGGSGCFPAGTKVKMADGSYVEIQNLKEGDAVYSYDISDGKLVVDKVAKVIVHENYPGGYLILNGQLKITGNHNVWIVNRNEWARTDSLNIGDTLLGPDGNEILVETIERTDGINTVYNLHLNGEDHNYFTEDILVHNQMKL